MGSEILDWMYRRVNLGNRNVLVCITGPTGSGKSFSALSIAEKVDPTFNVDRVVFSPDEFFALLNSGKLHKGNFFVVDEAGVALPSREFQSFTNKAMNFVLQTFRRECLGCIFTLPNLRMMDIQARQLLHVLIECEWIDTNANTVEAKVFFAQTNNRTGKVYFKNPKFSTPSGRIYRLNRLSISKPSQQLIDAYEMKKAQFAENLKRDLEASLKKLREKQARQSREEYFKQVLGEAQSKWMWYVSEYRKRKYIDKRKLKAEFPMLSRSQLDILQLELSKYLGKGNIYTHNPTQ